MDVLCLEVKPGSCKILRMDKIENNSELMRIQGRGGRERACSRLKSCKGCRLLVQRRAAFGWAWPDGKDGRLEKRSW